MKLLLFEKKQDEKSFLCLTNILDTNGNASHSTVLFLWYQRIEKVDQTENVSTEIKKKGYPFDIFRSNLIFKCVSIHGAYIMSVWVWGNYT